MTATWTHRARALLLTLLFAAGTLGEAGFDAIFFHRSRSEALQQQPHFETAGGVCGHGDQCALRQWAPGTRLVRAASAVTAAPIPAPPPTFRPHSLVFSPVAPLRVPDSRAPPALLS
ncbi:MAG TPA: hypothetical protein VLT17_09940 [Gemmatimonadales bacterium]|nr:hypothetical protein [Gemmatimonadales bacterium]